MNHPTKLSLQRALEEIAHSSVPAETSELPLFVELLRHIAKSALPSDENLANVEITLSMEEWGMIAMLAHQRDCTINEMITITLERYLRGAKSIDGAVQDVPNG